MASEVATMGDITSECIMSSVSHDDMVSQVSYNPDGSLLVSGSADGTIKIWDSFSTLHPSETEVEMGTSVELMATGSFTNDIILTHIRVDFVTIYGTTCLQYDDVLSRSQTQYDQWHFNIGMEAPGMYVVKAWDRSWEDIGVVIAQCPQGQEAWDMYFPAAECVDCDPGKYW